MAVAENVESLAQHEEEQGDEARRTFVVMHYGRRVLAVPFEYARRVARLETFSPLPAARPVLPGATNVDGHIVAVLDVGPLIGEPSTMPRPGMYLVVVADGVLEAGMITPRAPTLHEVPESRIRREEDIPFVQGMYGWPLDEPAHVVEILAVPRILASAQHAYE